MGHVELQALFLFFPPYDSVSSPAMQANLECQLERKVSRIANPTYLGWPRTPRYGFRNFLIDRLQVVFHHDKP